MGVDISKKRLDVSYNANETAFYANDLQGFKKLLNSISDKKVTRVAMEATGGYERPLVQFLQEKGGRLVL